jgi:hypothetical protein
MIKIDELQELPDGIHFESTDEDGLKYNLVARRYVDGRWFSFAVFAQSRGVTLSLRLWGLDDPTPWYVDYHSPVREKWLENESEECTITGGKCYGSGSALDASEIWARNYDGNDVNVDGIFSVLKERFTEMFGGIKKNFSSQSVWDNDLLPSINARIEKMDDARDWRRDALFLVDDCKEGDNILALAGDPDGELPEQFGEALSYGALDMAKNILVEEVMRMVRSYCYYAKILDGPGEKQSFEDKVYDLD